MTCCGLKRSWSPWESRQPAPLVYSCHARDSFLDSLSAITLTTRSLIKVEKGKNQNKRESRRRAPEHRREAFRVIRIKSTSAEPCPRTNIFSMCFRIDSARFYQSASNSRAIRIENRWPAETVARKTLWSVYSEWKERKNIKVSSRIVCFLSNSRLPLGEASRKIIFKCSTIIELQYQRVSAFISVWYFIGLSSIECGAHTGVENFPARRQGCSNNWQS